MTIAMVQGRAIGLLLGLLGVAAFAMAAGAAAPSESPFPGIAAGSTVDLPPFADVPEYRADSRRTGQEVGPGPVAEPVQVWSRTIDGEFTFRPILADGLLLVGGSNGVFYGLDARTGAERWQFEAGSSIADGWGSATDDLVVFTTSDGLLHALDLASGRELWQRPGFLTATSIEDGTVYAQGSDATAYGLDQATGEVAWSWTAAAALNGAFTVADGTLYAGTEDGYLTAVSVADGRVAWRLPTVGKYANAVSLSDDHAFVATPELTGGVGELYVVDRSTGSTQWTFHTDGGGNAAAGALGYGVVYVQTADAGQYAFPVEPAAAGGAPPWIWQAPTGGRSYRGQVLASDTLYVPLLDDPGTIIAFDPATGTRRWTLPVAAGPVGIVVSGGMLFEADHGGTVAAYAGPALEAAISSAVSGPLDKPATPPPPDPFSVVRSLPASDTTVDVPISLDVGPDGLLYVLDMKPSVVVIDPSTGRMVRTWGRQGSAPGDLDLRVTDGSWGIGSLDVGLDGRVYVADGANHRLQVFSADGTFVRQMGSYGSDEGQFSRPDYVLAGPDGSAYATDSDLHTLTRFGPDGGFMWRIGGPADGDVDLGTMHDPAWLPDGNLAVVSETGRVVAIDPNTGAVLDRWGTPGRAPGELDANCQLKTDADGNEYIFGCDPLRLQVFDRQHRLLGGAYAPRDTVLIPALGSDGSAFGFQIGDAGPKSDIVQLTISLPSPSQSPMVSPDASPVAGIPDGTYGTPLLTPDQIRTGITAAGYDADAWRPATPGATSIVYSIDFDGGEMHWYERDDAGPVQGELTGSYSAAGPGTLHARDDVSAFDFFYQIEGDVLKLDYRGATDTLQDPGEQAAGIGILDTAPFTRQP